MTAAPFEEPSKREMRAACEVALDQAGYQLAPSLLKVPMPAGNGLNGALIGDMQSLDAEGSRTFYLLRATSIDALPGWQANLARASHQLRVGELYVVVREYSTAFKQSCAAAGAGLLRLTDDNTFEVILAYADVAPIDVETVLKQRLGTMRRAMELKIKLRQSEIEQRYQKVSELVSEMPAETGESYMSRVEQEYKTVDGWATEISARLDGVTSETSASALAAIEEAINAGPQLPEDE